MVVRYSRVSGRHGKRASASQRPQERVRGLADHKSGRVRHILLRGRNEWIRAAYARSVSAAGRTKILMQLHRSRVNSGSRRGFTARRAIFKRGTPSPPPSRPRGL